jgi:hypothetical protein
VQQYGFETLFTGSVGWPSGRAHRGLPVPLERAGGRYGLQTKCEGGGQANITIIERL